MIAFGVAISDEATFRRIAAPGIARAAEPDSLVLERRGHDQIQAPYNSMLDEVARRDDLEALVLLHQDLEIRDRRLLDRLRAVLADPRVAIVGATGARRIHGLDWWRANAGVGTLFAPNLIGERAAFGTPVASPETAEAVDGSFLVLSAWAVRHLRFDPWFAPVFHGYDVDVCFEARRRGRLVAVTNLEVAHHAPRGINDRVRWVLAYARFAQKWRLPDGP